MTVHPGKQVVFHLEASKYVGSPAVPDVPFRTPVTRPRASLLVRDPPRTRIC
jgi:hypothetical protein